MKHPRGKFSTHEALTRKNVRPTKYSQRKVSKFPLEKALDARNTHKIPTKPRWHNGTMALDPWNLAYSGAAAVIHFAVSLNTLRSPDAAICRYFQNRCS